MKIQVWLVLLLVTGFTDLVACNGKSRRPTRWIPFAPGADAFNPSSAIDLRRLNERRAGDHGFIVACQEHFCYGDTGQPVRFWAVNGPAATSPEALRTEARQLAKYGVNLVRIDAPVFDALGGVDPAKARLVADIVDALKAEGIYSHLSIFFPMAWQPPRDLSWLPGYDGNQRALATLFFNPEFKQHYQAWWRALLEAKSPSSGKPLLEDPAVFGAELLNEDSLLFWTFNPGAIPEPQLRLFERQFAAWLVDQFGSLAQTMARWKGAGLPRDDLAGARMGFRPLGDIVQHRTLRDQDTVRFLVQTERQFFAEQTAFLRGLGFRGLITTSNWQTADPVRLGPLEKYVYAAGDFIDRHGYFGCHNQGENAEWSLRDDQRYVDRSALRFEAEAPDQPALYLNPAMDIHYAGKPTMLSEVAWNRPNRHRSEAPLFLAAYGALQGTDAIVHYHKDGEGFSVKPKFFMQPWTLASPAMFGQFPAAALIYRQGLVHQGDVAATVTLAPADLFALRGTPLPQEAAFDELRLKDLPADAPAAARVIDPLVHFVGPTRVRFAAQPAPPAVTVTAAQLDRRNRRVVSNTGELSLDYQLGVLTVAAPAAQGASGNLAAAGRIELPGMTITCPLDVAHIVLVSLDGQALSSSRRLLLQVMSEERTSNFAADGSGRAWHIRSVGTDPWLVGQIEGTVALKRPDVGSLRATALDALGVPTDRTQPAGAITLEPGTLYYLIAPAADLRR